MLMESIWILFLAGATGALAGDILKDNTIELPKKIDGKLSLGYLGSLILGGIAGYYIDGGIWTAFMGGFVGKNIVMNLVPKSAEELIKKTEEEKKTDKDEKENNPITDETIKELITRIAKKNNVDPTLAIRVAICESNLNPKAVGKNTNGTKDRGLYQWNDYYHPEITDEMAFNPEIATQKFCEAVNAGHISWWNASKKCWE